MVQLKLCTKFLNEEGEKLKSWNYVCFLIENGQSDVLHKDDIRPIYFKTGLLSDV